MWRRSLLAAICVWLLSGGAASAQAIAQAGTGQRQAAAPNGERPQEKTEAETAGDSRDVAATQSDRPSGANWAEMQRRYKGAFVLSGPKPSRQVALTFDDVPDSRYTPLVLNVLKQQKVKATFFVVGSRALKAPALVRRIHDEGHAIGNHSFNHPDFSKMGIGGMSEQIRSTEAALQRSVGFVPRLIRPPYGEIKNSQLDWAQKQGYTVVNWDVDSSDWRQLGAQTVFLNVTRSVRPGSIILLHAGGGTGQNLYGTVQALPKLIAWLRSHHYEPVTLPELLQLPESK
ncbi:polysaccharide deacetylase family protein [Cohnella sp. AR92]|uniref:polysaccharide deacetylase family protein n=1 Tax=Cohnella sp. AR92 TaxID=648716 RepID=UPI001EE0886C|nr:polysaccharide deacetylase family protein [Cohnella sp. AR92]